MIKRPLLYLAVAYGFGVVFHFFFPCAPQWPLGLALVSFIMLVVLCKMAKPGTGLAVFLCFIFLGIMMAALDTPDNENNIYTSYWEHHVHLTGMVVSEPDIRMDYTQYHLQVIHIALGEKQESDTGLVIIRTDKDVPILQYGTHVKAQGYFYMPKAPGNPGQFDYRAYLLQQGLNGILIVDTQEDLQYKDVGGGNGFLTFCLQCKAKLLLVAEKTLPEDLAVLLNGMIFGVTGQLTGETREMFSETGVNHILCVSGLHVGFILAVVMMVLTWLGLSGLPRFLILIAILGFYAVMTGLNPPVIRASIMALVVLGGQLAGRQRDWPSSLALALLIILFFSPHSLFTPGFQLSFAATWGILYLTKPIQNILTRWGRVSSWIAVPLAAQLATLPLIAIHFNLVTVGSVVTNVLVVPLMGIIFPLGLGAAVIGQISLELAGFIQISTGALLQLLQWFVSTFRRFPGMYYYVQAPSWFFMVIWYSLLWYMGKRGKEKEACMRQGFSKQIAFAFLSLFILVLFIFPWNHRGDLQLHFIDVGQGDSILLCMPNGKNILVDAGGKKGEFQGKGGAGETVVGYLRRLGINTLDALVITHPHEDHAGGVRAVIQRFPVNLVLISPVGDEGEQIDPGYTQLIRDIKQKGILVQEGKQGDRILWDEQVPVKIVNPPQTLWQETHSDLNNNSLVLLLQYHEKTILLSGDIEKEAQQRLLTEIPANCWLYKVAHHGSAYMNQSFVEKLNPRIGVISCGQNNTFGHPAAVTLSALEKEGSLIFRTDHHGAVIFTIFGQQVEIKKGKNEI